MSFWQQPGQMLPYLFALLLLSIFKQKHLSLQFRLILGCGCLLPLLLVAESVEAGQQSVGLSKTFPFLSVSSLGFKSTSTSPSASSSLSSSDTATTKAAPGMCSQWWTLLSDPAINKQLFGCMICWFCYDVYAYGIVLYTPEILEIIFGASDHTPDDYWQNVMCVAATFPAALGSVWVLGRHQTRTLQLCGFGGATFGFAVLAIFWSVLEKHSKPGLFVVFLLQKNLTQFGAGCTSMIMPNELFPRRVRSSCNGLAAAAGKVGAFFGAFVFPYVYDGLSIQAVFYGCAGVAALGGLTTVLLIPKNMGDPDAEDDAASSNKGARKAGGRRGNSNSSSSSSVGEGGEDASETTSLLSL
jgi:hypothetical protein